MKIIKTKSPIKITRGREPKYPFKELTPGNTLIIDVVDDYDANRVKAAFHQWKKYNKPSYDSRTQTVGLNVLIHAI